MERVIAIGKSVPVILDESPKRTEVAEVSRVKRPSNTKIRDILDYLSRVKSSIDSAYSDASTCECEDRSEIDNVVSSLSDARSDLDSLETMLIKLL